MFFGETTDRSVFPGNLLGLSFGFSKSYFYVYVYIYVYVWGLIVLLSKRLTKTSALFWESFLLKVRNDYPIRDLFPEIERWAYSLKQLVLLVSPLCVSMLRKTSAVIGPAWVFLDDIGLFYESDTLGFLSSFVIEASGVVILLDRDKQSFYSCMFLLWWSLRGVRALVLFEGGVRILSLLSEISSFWSS